MDFFFFNVAALNVSPLYIFLPPPSHGPTTYEENKLSKGSQTSF